VTRAGRIAAVVVALELQVLAPTPSWPQAPSRVPRIGFLSVGDGAPNTMVSGFRQGLRELGYEEGRAIEIAYRFADGRHDRLPALAEELVKLEVDVVVAVLTSAAIAAKAATRTIPVVMVGVGDPIGVGLVTSLARPGGNVTGTSTLQTSMVAKQLELIRQIEPTLTRIAVLWNPENAVFQALAVEEARAAAQTAGVSLQLLGASTPEELVATSQALHETGTRAVLIIADPAFTRHRDLVFELVARDRLITACGYRDLAEAGCLISYGPSYLAASKRAAAYVEKILKGTHPADLPVEQPTNFELVVNLKTAQSLGLMIPPTLLARADEVIE
jgi:putative ABC transport system substrate-binding protein